MTAIFHRQILWIWLCLFCLILRALGEYVLTTVPPGVNTTIYSNNTGPFSIDSLEVSIQEPIIEFRPTPPIVEPDLDPIGLQKPDDPFWNETGTPIQVDASQNSRRAEQYYGASTGSRNDAPGNRTESHNNSVGTITERSYIRPRSAIQNGITLRIMVLGASITWGAGSSDLNGFRYALRSALVAGGNPVDMVGSVNNGNMGDNQVEGWPGAIISDLSEKADNTLPQRPNVVIIQCGSNDMSRNIDPPGAAARMGALVDKILAVVPETLILVTGLMPMSNNMANDLSVNIYNPGLRAMVNEKSEEGKNVWFVDMNDGYITLSDLADGLHPSDGGFLKMARLYYDALVNLGDYIKPPQRVLGVDDTAAQSQPGSGGEIDTKCQKVPGNAIGPIQTQQGSGGNDGPYVHKGVDHGKLLYWQGPPSSPQDVPVINGVFWADMNGDGYDDLVYVPKNFQEIQVSINLGISGGKVVFADRLTFNTGIDCPTAGVNFADSNDNGIDDLFCIGANGDLRIWQNRPTTGGIPFANTWVGSSSIDMAGKLGFPLSRVRIADVDGDGRADYAIIRDNGDIEAWRNGGVLPTVAHWQNLGIVSSGKTFNDLSGIRLVDINGDGRDDLLWVSDTGTVTTWINHRGFSTGSLAPDWMPGIVTHGGPGIAGTRAGITFGKVWAGPLTRNHDYMITTITGSLPGVQIYENQGVGNGADDYIYVSASGDFHLFGNYQNPPAWLQYGVIYQRQFSSRKQIHFADWNGDGRCDILFVDRLDGRVNMARNDGFVDGKLKFYDYGLVSSTASCIQKNGMTTGYINRGINDMVDVGQIKAPIGADRANIRYADVNGDGKDDCLWVDKFTGKTSVWTNEGEDPSRPSGSFNRWQFRGLIAYGGSARGANIYWAKMKNQQRADYVINNPATNKANAYFNVCPKVPAVGPAPNLAPGPIRPLDYPFPSQRSFYSIGDSYSAGMA
ncbi:hypothetical protein B0O99DRAFT_702959 [Bisporella sp. PMI_857]|nr:hypothetical protein B0O99DRAFT_702959 [Bisporella sp. PMI_857]